MKHIYCISGLGADERVFSKFKFSGHMIHFIKWIIPEKNESIEVYAKKLITQIKHDHPVLIGLSFGGMMCIEMSKYIATDIIIIISSIKSSSEMPLWMRLSAKLKLNRLLPMRSFWFIEPVENYNLGVTTKEEKAMAHEFRKNVDPKYLNWAIDKALNWKNKIIPTNLYHIHGNKDRMFSIKKIKPDYIIKKGGHLMILNRSEEVNRCISSLLTPKKK